MRYGEAIPQSLVLNDKRVIRIGVLSDEERHRLVLTFETDDGRRLMLPITDLQELEPMGLQKS